LDVLVFFDSAERFAYDVRPEICAEAVRNDSHSRQELSMVCRRPGAGRIRSGHLVLSLLLRYHLRVSEHLVTTTFLCCIERDIGSLDKPWPALRILREHCDANADSELLAGDAGLHMKARLLHGFAQPLCDVDRFDL